jgi:hypothetical protein
LHSCSHIYLSCKIFEQKGCKYLLLTKERGKRSLYVKLYDLN